MSPDPATIAAIVTAVVASAGTGVSIYESTHQPKPSLRPNPQQVAQQKAQLASIARQDAPNTIEATGGGVSPSYIANAVANASGQQGNINQLQDIIRQVFGGGGTSGGPFSGAAGPSTVFPQGDIGRPPVNAPGQGSLVDPRIFGAEG